MVIDDCSLFFQGKKLYDFFVWILKMQQFSYMGMAFLLLKIDTTLNDWRSIGFLFYGIIAMQHAFAQFINLITGKVFTIHLLLFIYFVLATTGITHRSKILKTDPPKKIVTAHQTIKNISL